MFEMFFRRGVFPRHVQRPWSFGGRETAETGVIDLYAELVDEEDNFSVGSCEETVIGNVGTPTMDLGLLLLRGGNMRSTRYTFNAVLRRGVLSASWGLKLDFACVRAVHVSRIQSRASPVSVYNESVCSERRIQSGDYILDVNHQRSFEENAATGSTPAEVMNALFQSEREVKLLVARPQLFQIRIWRMGQPLGIDLKYALDGTSLLITRVDEECAVKRSAPQVRSGDRIIAVEGCSDANPRKMMEALKQARSDPVSIALSRS